MKDRRRSSPEIHQMNEDRVTNRIVVIAICAMAGACVATFCWCVLIGAGVPENFTTLTTFIVGNMTGILTKTGVDALNKNHFNEPVQVTTPDDAPLPVTEVEPSEETKTHDNAG